MNDKPSVLVLPGLGNSGPAHWQSHWECVDPSCERVLQDNWETPRCRDWIARLDQVIGHRRTPVVLVAHSSACALVVHWAASASPGHLAWVRGALLVAPTDPEGPNYPVGPEGFGPMPLRELPFHSILVASTDDPYIDPGLARRYAEAWGSSFVLVQAAGHLNASSGFGPWPEGYTLLNALRTLNPFLGEPHDS